MHPEHVLGLVVDCLWDSHRELAKTINDTRGAPLSGMLDVLTRAERTPGLPMALFGVIASAMQVLRHPEDEAKETAFTQRALRVLGLL